MPDVDTKEVTILRVGAEGEEWSRVHQSRVSDAKTGKERGWLTSDRVEVSLVLVHWRRACQCS